MEHLSNHHRISKLVLLLPLAFFLMPSLPIENFHFITYPLLVMMIIFVAIVNNNLWQLQIDKSLFKVIALLFLLSFVMITSAFINYDNIHFNAIPQVLKPLFFIFILIFAYLVSANKSNQVIINTLLKISYIFLFFQVSVGLTQLVGLEVFAFIYDDDKTSSLGNAVRIAGTMGNPNILSWFVIQMFIIILLFEKRKSLIWLSLVVVFLLILFSGSRSLLVLFPIIVIFTQIFSYKRDSTFYFVKIPLYSLLVYLIYEFMIWLIYQIQNLFPYLYQLTNILETGDLSSVNSFYARTVMWENGLNQLDGSWTFGLGPGYVSVMDNDFIYIIVNYGVIYLIIHLLLYIFIMYIFAKTKHRKFAVLGIQYILFSFIVGLQADTLVGWTYPVLIMFLAGLAIAMINNEKLKKQVSF